MSDVGRYRLVYPRLWCHPGFRALSKTARELVLYLLTGPQSNRLGLFRFSIATAAEDLNVGVETLRERLSDVQATFGWHFDAGARVFYIPSWWRFNPPQNANVLKGNLKDLNEIPPCALVDAFARNLGTLHETFHQTFTECLMERLGKRARIQEQDQKQKQDQKQQQRGASRPAAETDADSRLLPFALEALRLARPKTDDMNHLVDCFFQVAPKDCKRADAERVLVRALSERAIA